MIGHFHYSTNQKLNQVTYEAFLPKKCKLPLKSL